jgi:hypothetical protein
MRLLIVKAQAAHTPKHKHKLSHTHTLTAWMLK